MIVPYAASPGLPFNFCGEINFVVWRANARSKLDDQIFGMSLERFPQARDRFRNDVAFGAAPARVGQGDDLLHGVIEKDRTAIGDADDEREPRDGSCEGVGLWHTDAEGNVNGLGTITMSLLGVNRIGHGKSGGGKGFVELGIEGCQQTFAPRGKAMTQTIELQSGKCFDFHDRN